MSVWKEKPEDEEKQENPACPDGQLHSGYGRQTPSP